MHRHYMRYNPAAPTRCIPHIWSISSDLCCPKTARNNTCIWSHIYFRSRVTARKVSTLFCWLQLASTSYSVCAGCGSLLGDVLLAFFLRSNSRLHRLDVMKQTYPCRLLFRGVWPHTLGIGETVVMRTAVGLWLLCGDPKPLPRPCLNLYNVNVSLYCRSGCDNYMCSISLYMSSCLPFMICINLVALLKHNV